MYEAEAREFLEGFAGRCESRGQSYDLGSPLHEMNVQMIARELREKRERERAQAARAAIAGEFRPLISAALDEGRYDDAATLAGDAERLMSAA